MSKTTRGTFPPSSTTKTLISNLESTTRSGKTEEDKTAKEKRIENRRQDNKREDRTRHDKTRLIRPERYVTVDRKGVLKTRWVL